MFLFLYIYIIYIYIFLFKVYVKSRANPVLGYSRFTAEGHQRLPWVCKHRDVKLFTSPKTRRPQSSTLRVQKGGFRQSSRKMLGHSTKVLAVLAEHSIQVYG